METRSTSTRSRGAWVRPFRCAKFGTSVMVSPACDLAQCLSVSPRVRGSGPMWKIYHIGGSFRQIWRNVVQVKAGRDAQDVVISQETALYKAFCGVYGSGRGGGRVNLEALETAL